MINLRQSIIECYMKCPYKCLDEYGQIGMPTPYETRKEDVPTNKYALTGIAFHETMELWGNTLIKENYRMTSTEMKADLTNRFNAIPLDMFDGEEDVAKFRSSLYEQIDWIYLQACQTNSLIEVEKHFELDSPFEGVNLKISGTIDRIEGNMEKKDVIICDYKTGKAYTKNKMNNSSQVVMYVLAFYKMYGFYPKAFVFYFSKTKHKFTIPITQDMINRVSAEIVSIIYKMKNNEWEADNRNKYFCKEFCQCFEECPKMGKKKSSGWGQFAH